MSMNMPTGGTFLAQLTVRLPDELHTKIKLLSIHEACTINSMIVEDLQKRVNDWEREKGFRLKPEG